MGRSDGVTELSFSSCEMRTGALPVSPAELEKASFLLSNRRFSDQEGSKGRVGGWRWREVRGSLRVSFSARIH